MEPTFGSGCVRLGLLIWASIIAALIAAFIFLPPYSMDPMCTYTSMYQESATIEVDGRRYAASKTTQASKSRKWIAIMNSAGCQQKEGTVLPFRLADNRLVILRGRVCQKAHEMILRQEKVDTKSVCDFKAESPNAYNLNVSGAIIDNADRPTSWTTFKLEEPGSPVRLISSVAEPTRKWPDDELEKLAPAILRTRFSGGESQNTPSEWVARRMDRKNIEYHAKLTSPTGASWERPPKNP